MEYNCQNFKDGNVLTAECLNHIEKGVQHVCETLDCLCGDGQPEKLSEYVQSAVESSTPKEVANALKGSASGEVVALNYVSPIEREMGVSVRSKNLCSIGTVEVTTAKQLDIGTTLPPLKDGQVYIISCLITSNDTDADTCMAAFYDEAGIRISSVVLKRNERVSYSSDSFAGASKIYLYASNAYSSSVGDTAIFADIQIEVANSGAAASAYTPYVEDISAVTVSAAGKNLFDVNNTSVTISSATHTKDGNTYTVTGNAGTYNGGSSGRFIITFPNKLKRLASKKDVVEYTVSLYVTLLEEGIHGPTFFAFCRDKTNETATRGNSVDMKLGERVRVNFQLSNAGGSELKDLVFYLNNNKMLIELDTLQIEVGERATEQEPYKGATYPVSADGTVEGVKSIYPCTTLLTDTAGAVIDCSYNKDANKVVNSLIERIAALEAAVL